MRRPNQDTESGGLQADSPNAIVLQSFQNRGLKERKKTDTWIGVNMEKNYQQTLNRPRREIKDSYMKICRCGKEKVEQLLSSRKKQKLYKNRNVITDTIWIPGKWYFRYLFNNVNNDNNKQYGEERKVVIGSQQVMPDKN